MIDSIRRDIRQQWQESPLLRLGSWAIGLILLIYVLLWMDDRLALEQLEWRRAQANIAERQALAQQDYWPAMLEALENQREEALQKAWNRRTTGLAKAAVREFINGSVSDSPLGLRVRSVELAEPQLLVDGIHEMRGRFTVSTENGAAPWAWVADIERAEPALIIDSMDIRIGRKSGVAVIVEFRVLLSGIQEEQPG
ncbi:hypothetical protein C8D92_101282 [Tamilnaduibacter salinus]|uniref:Uncharacterized protein n=1 Tax=Tamilnaduibacter salinus TaxID=1484056 RepID=A0A2U1D110_9GAMM|nr:hypothetical protein [Tamilnaduibacter salinus]PVY79076.1 hypothetical protein C8D92_101282 [Tamilnaduibacter salinus]